MPLYKCCTLSPFLLRYKYGTKKQITKIAHSADTKNPRCNSLRVTPRVHIYQFSNSLLYKFKELTSLPPKSTIIHNQCVSTECCVHVARIKISIDNQHITKPMQRYDILPEQPKEKT